MKTSLLLLILIPSMAVPQTVTKPHKLVKPKLTKEERVKGPNEIWVMLIDTGIGRHDKLVDNVEYDQTENYVDNHTHGTHVAGIVVYGNKMIKHPAYSEKLCSNVRIFSCKYFDPKKIIQDNLQKSTDCVKLATKLKMDYINYSAGGGDFSEEEYLAYKEFTSKGGTVVTAAGNEKSSLDDKPYYPASYGMDSGFTPEQRKELNPDGSKKYVPIRILSVQNVDEQGNFGLNSNHSDLSLRANGQNVVSTLPTKNEFGLMTGTSQAAPQILHTILRQRCKEFEK